jgi:antitoxin VapB
LKGDVHVKKKLPRERELTKDLDAHRAHADELAEPLPHELEPLERLKGSVKKFERPTDPAHNPEDWDAWFDKEGVSADFMKNRGEK